MVCLGFSNGGQVMVAQALGAKKKKELNEIIGTLFTLIVLIALILSTVFLAGRTWILEVMNIPAESYDMTVDYFMICGLGLIFTAGYNMVSAVLRGMGDAKRPFIFIGIAWCFHCLTEWYFESDLAGCLVLCLIGDFMDLCWDMDWRLMAVAFRD